MTKRQHLQYLDPASSHFEHGMSHIGYDADLEIHTYRDSSGNTYETKPGNQYGTLKLVRRARSSSSQIDRKDIMWNRDDGKGPLPDRVTSVAVPVGRSRSRTVGDSLAPKYGGGRVSFDGVPPPEYPKHERFITFEQLDPRKLTTQEEQEKRESDDSYHNGRGTGGVLGLLGRAISVRKGRNVSPGARRGGTVGKNGRPRRRNTVAGGERGRS